MTDLEPIARLTRDLASAAGTLSKNEARFLVDAYYTMQDGRIRADSQVRALGESQEPHDVLTWLATQNSTLEKQVARALEKYADAHPVGQWAQSNKGIGPVITAGLLAHIDIAKAPTVGHIWRYAGLDPTRKWEKGQKRPWNATLKVLCWKIGESFVKVSGYDDAYYGKVYLQRKALELMNNEALLYKEQAEESLRTKKFGDDTVAKKWYLQGKLPPARIHERAKRYAVKLFLAHLHEVWYRHEFSTAPPLPYAIAHLGHAHKIDPPNMPAMKEATP